MLTLGTAAIGATDASSHALARLWRSVQMSPVVSEVWGCSTQVQMFQVQGFGAVPHEWHGDASIAILVDEGAVKKSHFRVRIQVGKFFMTGFAY